MINEHKRWNGGGRLALKDRKRSVENALPPVSMSTIPLNYTAILIAAVASMGIGALWYGPIFGTKWIALMGMTPEKMKAAQAKGMAVQYTLMMIGCVIMAFVMAHSIYFASGILQISGINAGLQGGFWNWLGFVVPVTLSSVLWEGKPWTLWFINVGYYLVSLLVMGTIIAVWM